jgi:diguanylate cyclase (GGDEF)-like protein
MPLKKFQRPRIAILALVVFGSLGLCVLGALSIVEDRQRIQAQTSDGLHNLAHLISEHTDRTLATGRQVLLQTARTVEGMGGMARVDPQALHQALRTLALGIEDAHMILAYDAKGHFVTSSLLAPGQSVSVWDRDFYAIHASRRSPELFISAPLTGRLSGEEMFMLSLGLYGPEGEFQGVVAVAARLGYFDEFYRELRLGEGGSVALFRNDGQTLIRYPRTKGALHSSMAANPRFHRAVQQKQGIYTNTSPYDQAVRVLAYETCANVPAIVFVSVPEHEVLAPWRDRTERTVLLLGASLAGVGLLAVLSLRELRLLERTTSQSLHDPLTGLPNRRYLDQHIRSEWARAAREGESLGVLFVDIDYFKRYNDSLGHAAGDACLAEVANVLRTQLNRAGDMAARYGGEEFVCVLPRTGRSGTAAVGRYILKAMLERAVVHPDSPAGPVVTVSVGCAVARPTPDTTPEGLFMTADKALYRAKQEGRNRLAFAGEEHAAGGRPAVAGTPPQDLA